MTDTSVGSVVPALIECAICAWHSRVAATLAPPLMSILLGCAANVVRHVIALNPHFSAFSSKPGSMTLTPAAVIRISPNLLAASRAVMWASRSRSLNLTFGHGKSASNSFSTTKHSRSSSSFLRHDA